MIVQGEDTVVRCPPPVCARVAAPVGSHASSCSDVNDYSIHRKGGGLKACSPGPLGKPQRLGLLLLRLSLGGAGLRRPLLTPVPTLGRGSGSLVGRVLGFVLPLSSRPFDHCFDLLGQLR